MVIKNDIPHPKVGFQTGGFKGVRGKTGLAHSMLTHSNGPILEGLIERGIKEIFHFNTSKAISYSGFPMATGWIIHLSQKGSATPKLTYVKECRLPLSDLHTVFIRGDDIDQNPSIEELYNNPCLDDLLLINPVRGTLATKDKFDLPDRFLNFPELLPPTVCATCEIDLARAMEVLPGNRLVVKYRFGSGGENVHLIDKNYLVAVNLQKKYGEVVIQQYIEEVTSKGDIRIVLVDKNVIGAYRRLAPEDNWLTNITMGGTVEPYALTPEMEQKSRLIAYHYPDVRFIGLDMTESGLLLETNAFPGSLKTLNTLYGNKYQEYILRIMDDHLSNLAANSVRLETANIEKIKKKNQITKDQS